MKTLLPRAASERLAHLEGADRLMEADEVLRVLARIARTGKPGDRLRAAELIGKQLGMFREKQAGGEVTFSELVMEAGRRRTAGALAETDAEVAQ